MLSVVIQTRPRSLPSRLSHFTTYVVFGLNVYSSWLQVLLSQLYFMVTEMVVEALDLATLLLLLTLLLLWTLLEDLISLNFTLKVQESFAPEVLWTTLNL